MEEQLRQKRLQWFGHLKRMPDNWPQKQVLRCRPCGKKQKPGGTSQRWVDPQGPIQHPQLEGAYEEQISMVINYPPVSLADRCCSYRQVNA